MDADIRRLARLASQGDLNAARALVRALERAQQEADEAGEWPMIPRSVLITARRSAMMSRLPQTIGRVPLEEASGHFRYDLTCPHEIIDGIIWMNFAAAIWDWPGRDPGRFGALALTVLPDRKSVV